MDVRPELNVHKVLLLEPGLEYVASKCFLLSSRETRTLSNRSLVCVYLESRTPPRHLEVAKSSFEPEGSHSPLDSAVTNSAPSKT